MIHTSAPPADHPSRTLHDALVQRYNDALEAWRRQDVLAQATRDSSNFGPGDEADRAAAYALIGEQAALAYGLRRQLDDLAVAVDRSNSGSYGRCEECGNAIVAARLELFPATTHCVACKQLLERR